MKRFLITEEEKIEILRLYLTEDIEHTKKLYSNWAKSKSGNYEAAMSIMNDVLYYRKNLPKKDFAKYTSYEELKSDLDSVKMKSQKKETKKSVEKDVDKIYEDDKLLIVKAKTWETSCKYGSGTKWCTAGRDTPQNWDRYNKFGTEFIWILKKIPFKDRYHKFSYHIPWSYYLNNKKMSISWCDALNSCFEQTPMSFFEKNGYTSSEINNILKLLMDYNKKVEPKQSDLEIEQENKEYIINWYESVEDTLIEDGFLKWFFEAETVRIRHSLKADFKSLYLGIGGVELPDWFDINDKEFVNKFETFFFNQFDKLYVDAISLIAPSYDFYTYAGDFFYKYIVNTFNLDVKEPIKDFIEKNENNIFDKIISDSNNNDWNISIKFDELEEIYSEEIDQGIKYLVKKIIKYL